MAISDRRATPTMPQLIGPCGINCRLCYAYAREKNVCPGCRSDDADHKAKTCANCRIKNCTRLVANGWEYCFECDEFPCFLVARLDKRYRTKYSAEPIDNLRRIQADGIDKFVAEENRDWVCPSCGTLLCMHKPWCLACGYEWMETD